MACCYRFIQYLIVILLLGAVGLLVTSGAIDYWWNESIVLYERNFGLWRICTKNVLTKSTKCHLYEGLLRFTTSIDTDIVLVSFCVSAVFLSMAFISMLCSACQRYPAKCLVLFEAVLVGFGLLACSFALVWAQFKIKPNHGIEENWAFFFAYGGTGLCLFALVFSITLLCMEPPGAYRNTKRDEEIVMLAAQ